MSSLSAKRLPRVSTGKANVSPPGTMRTTLVYSKRARSCRRRNAASRLLTRSPSRRGVVEIDVDVEAVLAALTSSPLPPLRSAMVAI